MALSSHDWTIVAAGIIQAAHLALTWKTRHQVPPAPPKDWFLEVPPKPPAPAQEPLQTIVHKDEPAEKVAAPVLAAHAAEPARPAHPDHSQFSKNGKRKMIRL